MNMPVAEMFFELLPRGRADYRLFVETLHRTAETNGIRVFDPLGTEPGPREFFRDTHHPTRAGAHWLSEALAEYLLAEGLPRQQMRVPRAGP